VKIKKLSFTTKNLSPSLCYSPNEVFEGISDTLGDDVEHLMLVCHEG
jgi:hypothetical protein